MSNLTFRERLHTEVWRPLSGNWPWMVYPCLFIGIGRAVFELMHFNTPVSDVPIMLISGAIIGVQLMSLFTLIFAAVIAWITHLSVVESLEDAWVSSVREKRPGASFTIPYWPIRIIAAIPTGTVFLALVVVWILLVFILPMQSDALAGAVSRLHPQGD